MLLMRIPVLSENSIRLDSRGELESAHHPVQCLRSSACLGCSWPTCSSRERGLRPRSFSCVINSTSAWGERRPVFGCGAVTEPYWCGWPGRA